MFQKRRPFSPPLARALAALLLALLGVLWQPGEARAAVCNLAAAQGATGPANWQTYCWLDFTGFSDATARSGAGQSFNYTLPDGTTMTFNLKITGPTLTASTSPSWSGASVGNSSFLGIGGRPVLYQLAAGTSVMTISSITLTPPAGSSAITSYMFVGADAESSNDGESLTFTTNGGPWVMLDQSGPISGATYPTTSGIGTATFNVGGVPGTVGAYIVGSTTPTQVVTTMVGGGLQGTMFAVRFASIRLNMQISRARVNAADQFTFDIVSTGTGTALASGTSTGTGLGPFTAAALSTAAALPLTLRQTMAAGSSSAIAQYRSVLSCTNASSSSTSLPSNLETTSYSFGALQFGDNVSCTFVNTPDPHLRLTKALGGTGRQFANDQFIMNIAQGTTVVATTTTTGTLATITNGSTPQVQVTPATAYSLYELGAGVTALNQYTSTMACTNAWAGSSTVLPTAPGGLITPQMGDVVNCTITNVKRATNATLAVTKLSYVVSDPVNNTANPKAIPGAVMMYTITVQNTGAGRPDNNTIVILDSLPGQIAVGTASAPTFTQGTPTSNLTFNTANDIRYSNAASPPTSFAACTYTPTSAFDPNVRYICINPKGRMAASTGTPPSFQISFRAQLN